METESLVKRAAPRTLIPSGYGYLLAKIFYLPFTPISNLLCSIPTVCPFPCRDNSNIPAC